MKTLGFTVTKLPRRYRVIKEVATLAILLSIVSNQALASSPKDSVKLLSLDWTSQQVLTKVLGTLLEENNIAVEYVHSDALSQWYKLANGQGDVQVEVWEGTMALKFQQLIDSGVIKEGGVHRATTREEWWYPDYVESLCPGLPNWRALKSCYDLFSEGTKRGIYYAGPWEKPDGARIRALDLLFDVVSLKDSEEINNKIDDYISKKQPLLIFNWTPNWVEAQYQGSFVEFPKYDEDCEIKPSWGINPKLTWDCGNPVGGWLKIAISKSLNEKSRCAIDIISAFSLDNGQVALASMLVDHQKMQIDDAAGKWLEENKTSIKTWTSHESCNSR